MNAITVVHNVSFASKPDSSADCTNMHVKANPNHVMNHSVNATSATNVCMDSCDLKANVEISSKTKYVNMQFKADIGGYCHWILSQTQPNATAKSLQKDPSVHLFAYNGSEIQYFGICHLHVHFKNDCFVINFYVVEKEKQILGLVLYKFLLVYSNWY